jgi:HlyD family secretion protein
MEAKWRRLIFWGVIAGLVLIGLVLAFRPQAVRVDVSSVARGSLQVTVDEEGKTRVHDIYVISAPVTGRMRRIDLHVGDPVVALETIVAEIEPVDPSFLDPRSEAEAEANVRAAESAEAEARAEVERAQAELDFAHSEFDRARELIQRELISQAEVDEAERSYRTERAALLTAQAALDRRAYELERARAQLLSPVETQLSRNECSCIALRSPVDGEILQLLEQSEIVVTAGTPLVEIGNARDLEIVVDVLSADAVRIEAGQRVIIEGWGGEQALEGRVRLVEPFGYTKISALGIEEQRVNVIVDIASPLAEWERLAHGYQIDARIVLTEREDVLKVPLTALFRDGSDWAVFVADDGRARLQHVTLSVRTDMEAQVSAGLDEGEIVILHPSDRIADGVRVAPPG